MWKLALLGVLILVCGALTHSQEDNDEEGVSGILPPTMSVVAQADGKAFFADDTPKTWNEARKHCNSVGMDLASIESPDQLEALVNARDNGFSVGFYGSYWTSGRDAHSPRQFSWNRSNKEPGSFIPINTYNLRTPLTCLFYDTLGQLFVSSCEETQGTLCEVIG